MANFRLLNNIEHKDLRVITERSADLGDNVWYVPAFPTEFRNLQRHYPIFFLKHPEKEEFQAVAMLGVEQDENLFLDESGWDASYIPLNILRQPFLVGFQEKKGGDGEDRETVVTIDLDSPRVNMEQGERLFLEYGGNTEYLEKITSILHLLYEGHKRNGPFFEALNRLNLLESFVLDVELDDGSQHRLAGFHTINEEVVNALGAEDLEMLHKRGYLEAIYMAIASMAHISDLIERKKRRLAAAAAHAEN